MSTIEATLSMMEAMPEDARIKVFEYTRELFTAPKPANPFTPLTAEQIFADLDQSDREIEEGKYRSMSDALDDMEKRYGFV